MDNPQIRYDQAGKPIRVPPWFKGTYSEFADCVASLDSTDCSFPNGATLDRSTGKPCRRCKVAFDACEKHGKTKARKNMRYAKYMPADLAKRMAEAHTDPELLHISQDIDLFQTRMTLLMERLETGESRDGWKRLKGQWESLLEAQKQQSEAATSRKQALEEGDNDAAAKHGAVVDKWAESSRNSLRVIGAIIMDSNLNEETWEETLALSERVSALKSRETLRRKDAGQTLSVEQALSLVQHLSSIVAEEVDDKNIRGNIAFRFATVLNIESPAIANSRRDTNNESGFLESSVADTKPSALSVEDMIKKHVNQGL